MNYSEGMLEWLTVEGRLTDGLPMRLYIAGQEEQICAACLHDDAHPRTPDEFEWRLHHGKTPVERSSESPKSELLHLAKLQVSEYFSGRRLQFDVPLRWQGTAFQIRVWQELARIPFGTTRSYQEIAEQIGNPKAARPVGSANGKNRLPLFVPCHRVVAAGGKLGGFTGGLGLKKRLLAHEAAVSGNSLPL
ncbi:MAG TPA: methylated-DNA--[protein]-cysteine S-methyltransferase [Bryobacteraceae bacterium]|nr:methylated-DNA--[protein]-cysteine S-methyltransferase [Bryobacteraceae bacterium]